VRRKYQAGLLALLGLGLAILLAGQLPLVANWQSVVPPFAEVPLVGRPSSPVREVRGIWLTNIDSDVLFERQRLSRALLRLSQLHFNTVYPTVWNWGYTLYPSVAAEKIVGRSLTPEPGLQNRDMLAEVISQGHRLGLKVVPWFEFGFMAPASSELARRHPDWITRRRNGTQIVQQGEDKRVWLNPLQPQVQKFILDLIVEIVANYNIDGIQFDDHFGLPVELGYDSFTVQLYQQEHQGRRPPNNLRDPEWMRWRAEKITGFMKRIFQTIKARRPNCVVALSPNPQSSSYRHLLLDWHTWVQRGLVEELVLQVYRHNLQKFTLELDRPEVQAAQRHIPVSIGIMLGLKRRPVLITQVKAQVQAVRNRKFAGVALFYYETLGNQDSNFKTLFPAKTQSSVLNDLSSNQLSS